MIDRRAFIAAAIAPFAPRAGDAQQTTGGRRRIGFLFQGELSDLSLLKTCPRPLICIVRTESLFGRHGQMAWDPLWDTAK
jgi:hypothetical protein